MTRARWMFGAIGALAALSLVPAGAQAASAPAPAYPGAEISSVVDGSRWVDFGSDSVVKTAPFGVLGDAGKWVVSDRFDGSWTIRNQQTNRCVQANAEGGPQVLSLPCQYGNPSQDWVFARDENGWIISPKLDQDVAVAVEPHAPAGSWLKLEPRWQSFGNTNVFRFDA
ncbi:hypothetical protein AB0L88_21525 [Saccharopolyspora shandongensis]|uniref:RICIN domain-containing protein n=1 Tax=Saccharopolyspora shandongensis TaxID=418495 RepID=UPI00344383C4